MKKIAIIGGGINGLFTSWLLAKNGYKIDLYEEGKILGQTSSSSSKLLHGGIRYLEQGHLGLVRESLLDRHWWLKNAGKFCKKIEISMPVYKDSPRSRLKLFSGAKLYSLLAGKYSLGPSKWVNKKSTLQKFSDIEPLSLKGSVSFYDAQMDEEKLGNWVARKTKESGTNIYEDSKVTHFNTKGEISIAGSKSKKYDLIINCAGPWAHEINQKNNIPTNFYLRLIRGSHLVLDRKVSGAFLFQEGLGKRIVFVLPYLGSTIIGTTEIPQNINDEVRCSLDEKNYLLEIFNKHFKEKIDQSSVINDYSGLRPIVEKNTSKKETYFSFASREAKIEPIDRLITVYGGKWTSAPSLSRKVAEKISKMERYID